MTVGFEVKLMESIMNKLAIFFLLILPIYSKQNNIWTNYYSNQICYPKQILNPKSKKELITFLKNTKKEKIHVRAVASGHSLSDIVCDDNGYLIDLSNFNKILKIDKKNKTVKVQAGIKICDLNKALEKENLALANQSSIDTQTIAGATATATHGTGKTGSLSSFIKEIELISADGKIYRLNEKNNPDYFAAAKVSIGSLGIITEITLECEKFFEIEKKEFKTDLKNIITTYKKLYNENDFFSFTWNPYNDIVSVNLENKIYRKNVGKKIDQKSCDKNDQILKILAEEIAIPFEKLPEALFKLQKFLLKNEKNGIKIHWQIICRFVKADKNCLLSPTFDRDSAYIGIEMMQSDKNAKKILKGFEDLLIHNFNGRPHWGKINFINYEKAYNLYGKNLIKFIEIKNSVDPDKIFSNSFTKRVFRI